MLGGSFCPPTKAHIEISNMCIEQGLCDKVIWAPVNEAYRKSTNIEAYHRVEMVKLALANEQNIDYSLHEQNHTEIIRTLESSELPPLITSCLKCGLLTSMITAKQYLNRVEYTA